MESTLQDLLSEPLILLTTILALGIFAQWFAWRLRLPSILLLLGCGFLLRHLAHANPDELIGTKLLFPLVSLSVATIMFEGGLTLQLGELKSSGNVLLRLVTVGVLVTWVLTSMLAHWIFALDARVAAIVGSILVVTGPTVIVPLLRHVRPARRISGVIKWEGIVIDPVGAMLAVLVFTALFSPAAVASDASISTRSVAVAVALGKTLLIGLTLATIGALGLMQAMRNYWIPDFLHNAVSLAVALSMFTISNVFQEESGLMTVTLMGIILANQRTVPFKHIVEFKENLRVLLISCLFIVLAARIEISQITQLGWRGAIFLGGLIVVVRPVAIWLSTIGSELDWRERTFLAFLAPRGIVAAAVAAVFALHVGAHAVHPPSAPATDNGRVASITSTAVEERPAVHANIDADRASSIGAATPAAHLPPPRVDAGPPRGSDMMVPITFLVIVGTVAFYGLLAAPLARCLGLSEPNPQGVLFAGAADWTREIARILVDEGIAVRMVDTNYRNISIARQKGIPVYCASILSEYICEEIELTGIGRLLAVTPNDDLNRLATLEFAHDFGRAEVYQLAPWKSTNASPSTRREIVASASKGRVLFREDAAFGNLAQRFAQGEQIKRTRITQEFTGESFWQMYGEDALILFARRANGTLDVATVDKPIEPEAGDTLIALVPADPAPPDSAPPSRHVKSAT